MSRAALSASLSAGITRAGLSVSGSTHEQLLTYLDLLARWNRRTNLTAFDLSDPSEQAIQKLIVEPLKAAAHVPSSARSLCDIGSGGGSPAVPLLVQCQKMSCTLVEARQKKAAFLREVLRTLELVGSVESVTFDELLKEEQVQSSADVVSFRAVRADRFLWTGISRVLSPAGIVLGFVDIRGSGVESVSEAARVGMSLIAVDETLAIGRRTTASF